MSKRFAAVQPLETDAITTLPQNCWPAAQYPNQLERSLSVPTLSGGSIYLAATKAKQALEEARMELIENRHQEEFEHAKDEFENAKLDALLRTAAEGAIIEGVYTDEFENDKLDALLHTAAEAVCSEAHKGPSPDREVLQSREVLVEARGFNLGSLEVDQRSEDSQELWDARWANMLQVLDDCIGDVEDGLEPGTRLRTNALPVGPESGSPTSLLSEEAPPAGPVIGLVDSLPDYESASSIEANKLTMINLSKARSEAVGAEAGKRLFRVAMML